MLSVGWQYLQSCSLVVCFVLAGYAGYHGYALPEARVCWVCWGDCRGSLLAVAIGQPLWAVWRPPEGYAVYWAIGYVLEGYAGLPGCPQGETSLRVWVWVRKISQNT